MYCRKCGAELPDGARFCGKCAAEQRPVSTPPGPPSPKKFGGMEIATRIIAAVGVISMFLPWVSIPYLRTLGQYASALGVSGVSGDYAYSIPGIIPILQYADYVPNTNQTSLLIIFYVLVALAWGAILCILIAGIIQSLRGDRSTSVLFGAGIALAVLGVVWAIVVFILNLSLGNATYSYAGVRVSLFSVPGTLYLSVLCGVVTAILARMEMTKNTVGRVF